MQNYLTSPPNHHLRKKRRKGTSAATNRMLDLVTASQIASASVAEMPGLILQNLLNAHMTDQWSGVATVLSGRKVHLFLGPRPGKKSMDTLASLDLTHCCTLLSERENIQPIRKICQSLGCEWVWLPIEGGRLDVLRQTDVIGHVKTLLQKTENEPEPRIYFHCSAGIHRTGFFVYILLRLRGLSRDKAVAELTNLRIVTAEQVGEERLDLADELVASATRN